MTRYAITGATIANCLGADHATVVDRAFAGADGFSPATAYCEFPFTTTLGVMAIEETMRLTGVALPSARALEPAVRAAIGRWGADRVAYLFASSTGGLEETERTLAPNPRMPATNVYSYANHGIDATSDRIAEMLGATGVRMSVSTACSSSFKALASAARLIDAGLADAAVVGSADSLCRTTIYGFHSLGLLAPTPTAPFSQHRAGITLGEGSAFIVLERETSATQAHALAWLAGLGSASDAFHHTSPHPEGLGGQLAMRQALERAQLSPNAIGMVSAHGTGTKLNDAAEALAIARVFERHVPVTATKSLTGHTLGSAGLTALVLALESLRRQEIPASLRANPIDGALDLAVVTERTTAPLEHVLINAFGFGGSNASAVVSR